MHSGKRGIGAVFLGYGYEALARASHVLQDGEGKVHLDKAQQLCETVEDTEERKFLGTDLDELKGML